MGDGLVDLFDAKVVQLGSLENVDVGAEGLPAGGVGRGAEKGESGGPDDSGEVTGACVVANQCVGGAEGFKELNVVGGLDDLGDGREVVEVFLVKLFFLDFAQKDADAMAAFDELAHELHKMPRGPALGRRASAGVDAERSGGRAFIPHATLRDRAKDLVNTGFDDGLGRKLFEEPLRDVTGKVAVFGRAWLEMEELGLRGEGSDVLAPGVARRGDEGKDGMGVLERFACGFRQGGGVAKEVVPTRFDIDRLRADRLLGELSLFPGRDVEDARLGVETAQRQGEGPGDDEVAQRSLMKDQNVSAEHGG